MGHVKRSVDTRRLRQRWSLLAIVVGMLLIWPTLSHSFRLFFSEEYRQQQRLEQEEALDRAAEERVAAIANQRANLWWQRNPGKVLDNPYLRTFIASVPQGLARIHENGVLLGDGRWLGTGDLIRLRVHPQSTWPPESEEGSPVLQDTNLRLTLWSNGVVLEAGSRRNYRTGQDRYSEQFRPARRRGIKPSDPPTMIRDAVAIAGSTNSNFDLILRSDGSVWSGGGNEYGQLGSDVPSKDHILHQVSGLKDVKAIAAGVRHAVALTKDGRVWQWGQNDLPYFFWSYEFKGEFGEDATRRAPEGFNPIPRPVDNLPTIVKIAASGTASFALDQEGFVWVWGGSGRHCRVIPAEEEDLVKTRSLSRPPDSNYRADRLVVARPYRIKELSNVVDIQVAETHAVVLRRDGTVWGWGCNAASQIGQAEYQRDRVITGGRVRDGLIVEGNYRDVDYPRPIPGIDRVKKILATSRYTAVMREDDTLWFIGLGCRLCGGGIARNYSYALKVKNGSGGKRLLEFEASMPSNRDPRDTEFGIYWVDDSSGRVDGVAPWESGYAQRALDSRRAETIFSRMVPEKTTKRFEADSGRLLAFYIINGGSRTQWLARNSHNQPDRKLTAYFSFPMSNPGQHDPVLVDWFPDSKRNRLSIYWRGPVAEDNPFQGGSLAQAILVRGVRKLQYEELPNHNMAVANGWRGLEE